MKVHDTLEELLEDFAELIWVNTNEFRKPDFKTYAESYLSSNSLALGKQKPLAKNKGNGNICPSCYSDSVYKRILTTGFTCNHCYHEWGDV